MNAIKAAYMALCAREPSISLFSQDWWLDAVCTPDRWDVAMVRDGDAIDAAMPYFLPRPWRISMPPLTQTMGPWLRPAAGKPCTRLSREMELMDRLINALPRVPAFRQRFHHSLSNWLPFHWRGFEQSTRYTYRLPDLGDLARIQDGMDNRLRTSIRKAERNRLEVIDAPALDIFLRLNDLTYGRQHLANPVPHRVIERVWAAASARSAGRCLLARDHDGRFHAGILLVWTPACCYYLMGGSDPALRASGAPGLLLWHGIRFAATVSASFDFEGSMLPDVEASFRKFGAEQTPYSDVWRYAPAIALPMAIRRLARGAWWNR